MTRHAHRPESEDRWTWRELFGSLFVMVLLVVDLYAAILILGTAQ